MSNKQYSSAMVTQETYSYCEQNGATTLKSITKMKNELAKNITGSILEAYNIPKSASQTFKAWMSIKILKGESDDIHGYVEWANSIKVLKSEPEYYMLCPNEYNFVTGNGKATLWRLKECYSRSTGCSTCQGINASVELRTYQGQTFIRLSGESDNGLNRDISNDYIKDVCSGKVCNDITDLKHNIVIKSCGCDTEGYKLYTLNLQSKLFKVGAKTGYIGDYSKLLNTSLKGLIPDCYRR